MAFPQLALFKVGKAALQDRPDRAEQIRKRADRLKRSKTLGERIGAIAAITGEGIAEEGSRLSESLGEFGQEVRTGFTGTAPSTSDTTQPLLRFPPKQEAAIVAAGVAQLKRENEERAARTTNLSQRLGSSEDLTSKDLIGSKFESSLQTKPQSTRFGGTNLVNQFDQRVQRNLEQRASTLAESQRNKRTNQLLDQLRTDRDDVLNNTLGLGKSTARERIAAISGFNEAVGDLALSGGGRGAGDGSRGRRGKTFEEELLLKQTPTGDKLLGLGFDQTKLASEERRDLSGRLSREGIAANSELRQRRSSRAQRAQEGFSRSALAEEAFQDNDIVEGLGYLDIDIFDLLGGDEDTSRDSMEKLINSGLTNDDIVNIKRDLVNRIQVGR